MPNDRPNLLLLIADDASHFSAYGHPFVRTPNFDRIAEEGILFTRAFTTNPKCAPSRASILTGRHTWQNGAACLHWNHWPEDLAVYTDHLDAAGYDCAFTGKPWAPGDWKRSGRTRNPAGTGYNAHKRTPPEGSLVSDCDYAADMRDFLAGRDRTKPFCFWCGVREPHRGYAFGEGRRHGKRMEEITEVPPYWPDDEAVREDMLDYAFEVEYADAQFGKALELLAEFGELENTLVVATSDNGAPFPRVKGMMYDDDFRLPCAAMWRGRTAGGRVVDDLCSFIDFMPTFLDAAGVATPDELPGRSLMDILDSDASGSVNPERNRAYLGRERHDLGREGDVGYPVRCVRTPEYLYVRNFKPELWPACNPETGFPGCDGGPTKDLILSLNESGESAYFELCFGKHPAEELFHIPTDPHCMTNLAADEAHQEVRIKLREELETVLRQTGDPRMEGAGDVFDSYEYVGHDEAAHSWKAYVEGWYQPQKH